MVIRGYHILAQLNSLLRVLLFKRNLLHLTRSLWARLWEFCLGECVDDYGFRDHGGWSNLYLLPRLGWPIQFVSPHSLY